MTCKGCLNGGFCDFQIYGNKAVDNCPCTKCIVKTMCKESGCEEVKNHHKIIFGFVGNR